MHDKPQRLTLSQYSIYTFGPTARLGGENVAAFIRSSPSGSHGCPDCPCPVFSARSVEGSGAVVLGTVAVLIAMVDIDGAASVVVA
jgi:hypothetical protein